ncbi:thaumatin [Lineolata rhizophorae]|uniref:Thaumatin n=1 Tax=Lineolata rhizophorae TaxID=578093 RepID=A0A6A6PDE5_9PEZI|nr:thaumatin [Lineolata rhizophorae]
MSGVRWPRRSSWRTLELISTYLYAFSTITIPQPAVALHHLKARSPPLLQKRAPDLPLVVSNNCDETIWPGIETQSGDRPESQGFKLEPGESRRQLVAEDWQGRVWGRTNCTFDEDGNAVNGPRACLSGDCRGVLDCEAGGDIPVTLAEFTLNGGDDQCYYDISLVDGYNVPLSIIMVAPENGTLSSMPTNRTNPSCIATKGHMASPDFDPYNSASSQFVRSNASFAPAGDSDAQTFLGTNSSFPLAFVGESVSDDAVARWCPWDLQVSPPWKPGEGVYPYPDDGIERPVWNPCLSACAKWNRDEDCCRNDHDEPGTCHPSLYSRHAKKVCPDAYSYGE